MIDDWLREALASGMECHEVVSRDRAKKWLELFAVEEFRWGLSTDDAHHGMTIKGLLVGDQLGDAFGK